MSLTCECGDYDPEPGDVYVSAVRGYTTLATKRSRKCCSCDERIAVGDLCCEVSRCKVPEYDVERSIWGDDGEVPMAPMFLCERCADLYFSLEELGFCVNPWQDQRELVADYAEMKKELF